MSLRRTRRDPPSTEAILDLLNRWVKTGDPDVAIVAADALRERGHEHAADDLDRAIRDRCRDRRSARERIFSELLNGGIVLDRGAWESGRGTLYGPSSRRTKKRPSEYLLVFEENPTHWTRTRRRRVVRRGSRPEPRYVIWEQSQCRWQIWGEYEARDSGGSLEGALENARLDISDMKLGRH